jgi:hypothetical protein
MRPLPDPPAPEGAAPQTADAVLDVIARRSSETVRAALAAVPDDALASLLERLDPRQRHGEPIRQRVVTRLRAPDPTAALDDSGELDDAPTDPVTGQRPPDLVSRSAATSPDGSQDAAEVQR